MRAVLDPNILIAAALSPAGAPASILRHWLDGAFELVASEQLLDELARALTYPKLRSRIAADDALLFVEMLRRGATLAADDPTPARRSRDRGDDYLLALAAGTSSIVVTGDQDLLTLAPALPVRTAGAFLAELDAKR